MRGIEGALLVLEDVESGAFAAESLRKKWQDIVPSERKLTATIVYLTLRRLGLWRHLLARYCKRPLESLSPKTISTLLPGIAGVLELRHFKPGVLVNALVQKTKLDDRRSDAQSDAALVNAVLHTVMDHAPSYVERLRSSPALRDQALGYGVPGWVAAAWNADWGIKETKRLLQLTTVQTTLGVRLDESVDRAEWAARMENDVQVQASELSTAAALLDSNPYPPDLPGYAQGLLTPQGESSIWAVETLLQHSSGDSFLDMCMGRGIKAGHILAARKDAVLEGWDLSAGRMKAAEREFKRLGVESRARTICGDAMTLVPQTPPQTILLDVPCSGSGTWGRHPEGKWRLTPAKLDRMMSLQKGLFSRAADILPSGGVIMYCTCSLFRAENEKVVGDVLAGRQDLVEIPIKPKTKAQKKGRPYGALILPETPWLDGFYVALFKKKA